MPLYEYRCEKCEQSTDIYMQMSEKRPETIVCEHCGAIAKRVFSTGAAYIKKTYVGDVWDKAGVDPQTGNKGQIKQSQNARIKKMREKAQAKINTERNKK